MFIGNLFQHVWNKVYFNTDLPKDRTDQCHLGIGKALFEFFVPTTKRKNSVSQWLGFYQSKEPDNQEEINSISDLNVKAFLIILIDVLLYIPRLALNIIKLVTEVWPLMLRELAYAAFESMVKGADENNGISKRLYQLAAGACWLFTSVFSLVYLIGGLLTSPDMTIISMMYTLDQLKCPMLLALPILGFFCLLVFAFYLAMIVILSPIILPISAMMAGTFLVINGSGWIGGAVQFALVFFCMSGLMFNNDPDNGSLFFVGKTTSLSIYPTEFLRIFDEKSYQHELWELKIKNLGDKAKESQKLPYKKQAEKDPIIFLKICKINVFVFSIEEQNDFFSKHKLRKLFASAERSDAELFKVVVGKILYRLGNECKNENNNIDLVIAFVELLPDWVFLSLESKDNAVNFSDLVSRYAQSSLDKLNQLLTSSVCRTNTTWIIHYITENIWVNLVDPMSLYEEKQQSLKNVLPFLSLLSDEECNFLVECQDLNRMYQSVGNAKLVLSVLPSLFAHCAAKLVSCYYRDGNFMNFLKENQNQLNFSGMINKIIDKKELTDEIKLTLTRLYSCFSSEDQEKINKTFPNADFSNYSSDEFSPYDNLFASESAADKIREREQHNNRMMDAESYAKEGIDLYKIFNIEPSASCELIKTATKAALLKNRNAINDPNVSEAEKLEFQRVNNYREILLCPHARLAYDQARATRSFFIFKMF